MMPLMQTCGSQESPAPCYYQLTHRKLARCIRLSTSHQDITCGYTNVLGFSSLLTRRRTCGFTKSPKTLPLFLPAAS